MFPLEMPPIEGLHERRPALSRVWVIADICAIIEKAGADFIKTSTGYGSRGASVEDIKLFKKYLKKDTKIKASGGVRTREDAETYIGLGCSRIGASSGIAIVTGK